MWSSRGKQIPDRIVVAPGICARKRDLRSAIRCRAARDHDRADRRACDPSGYRYRHLAGEVVRRPRISEARRVEQGRRKDMLLLRAHDLFAQPFVDRGIRVLRRRSGIAIVDGIHAEEQIVWRKVRVDSSRAKIFADVLRRVRERLSDAARRAVRVQQLRTIRNRPQGQQRLHSRYRGGARCIVRNKGERAQAQVLPIPFVVAKGKELVMAQTDRPAQRRSCCAEIQESSPGRSSCAHPARCYAETHKRNHAARCHPRQ